VLKKSVSIAVSGSPVASVAKCTPISTETKGSFAKLTKSQLEVVKRMASGDTIKGIALDLGLSESTVEYHFHHARDRIGFRSIAHVTQWALKNHLIDFTI
jgi:DNA-binding NarL/FixJ family response regulator